MVSFVCGTLLVDLLPAVLGYQLRHPEPFLPLPLPLGSRMQFRATSKPSAPPGPGKGTPLKHLSPRSVFYLYVLWMRNCTWSRVGTYLELLRKSRGCRTAAMKLGWSSGSSTWGSSFGAFLNLITLKGVGLSESSPRALAISMEGHPHELLFSVGLQNQKKKG